MTLICMQAIALKDFTHMHFSLLGDDLESAQLYAKLWHTYPHVVGQK